MVTNVKRSEMEKEKSNRDQASSKKKKKLRAKVVCGDWSA
jgi:hypothetical protein